MSEAIRKQSVLTDIMDHLLDGELPEDYSLPKEETGSVRWADGAADGVAIYHTAPPRVTMEISSLIDLAIHDASEGRYEECCDFLRKLSRDARAVNLVETVVNFILQHQQELDPEGLYNTARRIAYLSPDPETVKYGLIILELLDTKDEDKPAIRTLGLSDELTLFVILNMLHWENGNEEVFQLAQKVHGWGRIHACEYLEPGTSAINNWFLREGIRNNVMPQYSALTAWNKSGAFKRLFGRLSREDYTAIRDILAALLEEGPVAGVSEMENAEFALMQFVRKSYAFPLSEEDLAVIEMIREYAQKTEWKLLISVLEEFGREPEGGSAPDDLLAAKIKSHLPQQREIAVRAIGRWLAARSVPLEELSPKLYAAVMLAEELEPIEGLRAEMTKLLGEEAPMVE